MQQSSQRASLQSLHQSVCTPKQALTCRLQLALNFTSLGSNSFVALVWTPEPAAWKRDVFLLQLKDFLGSCFSPSPVFWVAFVCLVPDFL